MIEMGPLTYTRYLVTTVIILILVIALAGIALQIVTKIGEITCNLIINGA